jgi:hypothetical protein
LGNACANGGDGDDNPALPESWTSALADDESKNASIGSLRRLIFEQDSDNRAATESSAEN